MTAPRAADLARELAAPLNITAHQLLVPVEPNPNLPSLVETSDQDSLDSLASSGEGRTTRSSTSETIDWTVASRAMQACMEQVVLIIRVGSSAGMARGGISSHQQQVHTRETSSEVSLSDALLSRLVGCVANSHIAAQVLHSPLGWNQGAFEQVIANNGLNISVAYLSLDTQHRMIWLAYATQKPFLFHFWFFEFSFSEL